MHEGDIFGGGDWRERLESIVHIMRDVSCLEDPQRLVATYREHLARVSNTDGFLSLSRRGVEPPAYLIARSSRWEQGEASGPSDPWRERAQLPRLEGGLLGELMDCNKPRLMDDVQVSPDDPAYEFLQGMRSIVAIPIFDHGEALNMVVQMRRRPHAFDPERVPQMVWMTNLFSRATHGLVLSKQLAEAHAELAAEQASVGEMQRALLPEHPPAIPGLDLAVHYRTTGRAGGDYYDFFPLSDGRWGVLLADVSGHGTPAAVLMAITHALAHQHEGPMDDPSRLLSWLNTRLAARYTTEGSTFVTALYGVYDPERRSFVHALAGHPPPRVCNGVTPARTESAPVGLPLGVEPDTCFDNAALELCPGDRMLLFTDGLTEARNEAGDQFGMSRTDASLAAHLGDAPSTLSGLLQDVEGFTGGPDLQDDLTLLVAQVMDDGRACRVQSVGSTASP